MREISGYVCAAGYAKEGYDVLYGKDAEDFQLNDFTPFTTRKEALRGRVEILECEMILVARIAHIELRIAQSAAELPVFEKEKELVVIALPDEKDDIFAGMYEIVGPRMEGLYGCINGVSSFASNGFVQFREASTENPIGGTKHVTSAYQNALYVLSEVNRQARQPATIATCRFTWISKPKKRRTKNPARA